MEVLGVARHMHGRDGGLSPARSRARASTHESRPARLHERGTGKRVEGTLRGLRRWVAGLELFDVTEEAACNLQGVGAGFEVPDALAALARNVAVEGPEEATSVFGSGFVNVVERLACALGVEREHGRNLQRVVEESAGRARSRREPVELATGWLNLGRRKRGRGVALGVTARLSGVLSVKLHGERYGPPRGPRAVRAKTKRRPERTYVPG